MMQIITVRRAVSAVQALWALFALWKKTEKELPAWQTHKEKAFWSLHALASVNICEVVVNGGICEQEQLGCSLPSSHTLTLSVSYALCHLQG